MKIKEKGSLSPESEPENNFESRNKFNPEPVGNNKLLLFAGAFLLAALVLVYFLFFNKKNDTATVESKKDTVSGNSSTDLLKSRELDLKEKELELKEQELKQQKELSDKLLNEKNKTQSTNKSIPSGNKSGIYSQASERYLTSSDLIGLSQWDLKIMRNEIFARHGYIFQTDEMRNYFSGKSWYNPRYYDVNDMLTKVEKENITLIKNFER